MHVAVVLPGDRGMPSKGTAGVGDPSFIFIFDFHFIGDGIKEALPPLGIYHGSCMVETGFKMKKGNRRQGIREI